MNPFKIETNQLKNSMLVRVCIALLFCCFIWGLLTLYQSAEGEERRQEKIHQSVIDEVKKNGAEEELENGGLEIEKNDDIARSMYTHKHAILQLIRFNFERIHTLTLSFPTEIHPCKYLSPFSPLTLFQSIALENSGCFSSPDQSRRGPVHLIRKRCGIFRKNQVQLLETAQLFPDGHQLQFEHIREMLEQVLQ